MEEDGSKTLSAIKLILAAILIVLYLIVLFLSLKPDITNEYRLYYIDKTSKRWPGQDGYDCTIGQTITFDDQSSDLKKIDRGRRDASGEGCLIEPDLTVIYLASMPQGDYVVTMEFAPSEIDELIDVSVTGCSFSEQFVPDSRGDSVVEIPISLNRNASPEDNLITIRISSGSHDLIMLKEVTVNAA